MVSILRRAFWFIGVLVLLLIIFLPGFTKLQELRDKSRELEASVKKLKIENVLLQEELKRLENDPVYQEGVVREKLGVVRRGEIPIKIIPEKKE